MGTRREEPIGAGARAWHELLPGDAPYRALIEGVTDYAILLMDLDGVVKTWNAGAALVHGYAAERVIGQNFSMFYTAAEAALGHPVRALEAARRQGHTEEQGWRVRADGVRFWARIVINALRDEDGTVYGFGQIVRDLTQDRRREDALRVSEERTQALREQAMRDPLTGAFNRRDLLDYLRSTVDRSGTVAASVLAIDLDHFKAVNDHDGHDVGDAVLVAVARLAGKLSRDCDRLFRVGGDEFLMYLPGVDRAGATVIAERLREAVARARIPEQRPITVSIGVAQLRPEDSIETWIQNADVAMYAAKRAGRNRVL